MSAKLRPGQTAEIAGPKHAMVFPNPTVVASMIKRAKRPLLVIGSKAPETVTEDGDLIDYAIKIGSDLDLNDKLGKGVFIPDTLTWYVTVPSFLVFFIFWAFVAIWNEKSEKFVIF